MKGIEKQEYGKFVEYRYLNKSQGIYIMFQCKKKNAIDAACLLPSLFKHIWVDNAFIKKGDKK